MKKIISTFTLLIGVILQLQAQVTGFAYLNGQTNHSGIKVKFVAQSPSAKTDSTFTNSDGSYSKSVQAGVYTIKFTKGIDTSFKYISGNGVLINTPIKLDNVYLDRNTEYLFGNVKGVLKGNTTYIFTGEITVNSLDSLFIEPGCILKFNSNSYLKIDGRLISNGTENKQIIFTSNDLSPFIGIWDGIRINSSNLNNSFSYCLVEYASRGLESEYSNTYICYNIFRKNDIAVWGLGNSTIQHNEFYGNVHSIYARSIISDVKCNTIRDGQDGITIDFSNNQYYDNLIQNMSKYGFQIGSGNNVNLEIRNNFIKNTSVGIFINNYDNGNQYAGVAFKKIHHNSIINSGSTIQYEEQINLESPNVFFDNIILNAEKFLEFIPNSNSNQIQTISYSAIQNNLFFNIQKIYNNTSDVSSNILPGMGDYFAINNKLDSIDVYGNILMNPKLDSTYYFQPFTNSSFIAIGYSIKNTCWDPLWFQSADTLILSGTIHQTNSFLKYGKVIAHNIDKNSFKQTITDVDGNFVFDSLSKGNYIIKAIPNVGDNYLTTYFPNKSDSLNAFKINLDGDVSSVDIFMNTITGIDIVDGGSFNIKPNPFDNQIVISVGENIKSEIKVTLLNSTGESILNLLISEQESEFAIDSSNIPSGFYFLKLESKDITIVEKVLKR